MKSADGNLIKEYPHHGRPSHFADALRVMAAAVTQESCKEATLVGKLELQANGDGVPSRWCLWESEVISRFAWNRGMDFGRDKQGVLSLVQKAR